MTITNTPTKRSVTLTDYIPLQVRTERDKQLVDYCTFRKGDSSLLEFAFGQENHIIQRITLVICADYSQVEEVYQIPAGCEDGDVLFDSPAEIETAVFSCRIYSDAVKVKVSDAHPYKQILSNNIVWEVSEEGAFISLCVLDKTGAVSKHCLTELSDNS